MSSSLSTKQEDALDLKRCLEESERRSAELERTLANLSVELTRVQSLVENSGAGVIVVDSFERVVWTNNTFRKLFYVAKDERSDPTGSLKNCVLLE